MEFGDSHMPIGFAMALAQDIQAVRAFSAMSNEKQDEILALAHRAASLYEMQELVQTQVLNQRADTDEK